MRQRRARLSFAFGAAAAFCFFSLGCRDVSQFRTEPGQAYCGELVPGPFVRAGFPSTGSVFARVTFDPDRLEDSPGTIATSDHLLDDADLRPMPQIWHDALSTLQFGDGRDKNFIFATDPTDTARGGSLLVVLSLLRNGSMEARLLRGAPARDGGSPTRGDGPPIFGVFSPLSRKAIDQCTF